MVANDDFDGKATHINCFYMHMIFEQKYPKPAIVRKGERRQKLFEIFLRNIWIIPSQPVIADSWGCHFSESEKKAASVFLFPLRASLKHTQRFPTMVERTLMNLKKKIEK